jgi:hypothetical protein
MKSPSNKRRPSLKLMPTVYSVSCLTILGCVGVGYATGVNPNPIGIGIVACLTWRVICASLGLPQTPLMLSSKDDSDKPIKKLPPAKHDDAA